MKNNPIETFHDLKLSAPLMKAIDELGYETPSAIQAQALPLLLEKPTDFLGLAATGTGKTAAFSIPLLEQINPQLKKVQAIVLCPTRELALQVMEQINLLGKFKGTRAVAIYGGANMVDQIQGLKKNPSIVVGTPGRVIDHLERGTLKLDSVSTVVLDEADEMISMGFKEDLETILDSATQEKRHIWLFSATMSPEVRRVADEYLVEPQQVHINRKEMLSTTVEQIFYVTQEANKPEVLCKLIDSADGFYGLIFCQTKSLVSDLARYLTARGYQVDSLHGDKDQRSRERTMQAFRDHKVNILVCTDVASRGLDVKDVTHVINYSIPRELDLYVHRIGRTARSGKSGLAMSLVTPSHRSLVGQIERLTKSKMIEGKIPGRKEVGVKKIAQFLERFQNQEHPMRAAELLDESWKNSLEAMTKEEIASRFLAVQFPEIFIDQKSHAKLTRQEETQSVRERRSDQRSDHRSGRSSRNRHRRKR